MYRRTIKLCMVLVLLAFGMNALAQKYKLVTYQNDPMNVQHYTLDNGLQVFLSVNKDVPRIQTYIAVRVGSKNDPKESTGLSHYLEHLMFKGTTHFGTLNWEVESKYIKEIGDLYEIYNKTTDAKERKVIYHRIDSVSYLASKYAIPNEYDKMMSMIGAQNTNAFTSNDMTVYQEDIPSNEVERWLKIESERFKNPVFRLFHTELEAVYEEKNMNMAKDSRTLYEALNLALYPHHPYGTQTTIGTIEHLKNPSLENIKKHFNTYYVPNNYCIAMSGDFNPTEVIGLIAKYFGDIQPKYIPDFTYVKEDPISGVQTIDVYGLEAGHVRVAYRLDAGNGSRDVLLANMIEQILSNGNCGIMDENINQKQLAQYAAAGVNSLNDYASFMLVGVPKEGQSLSELKDLLIKQIDVLKSGEWDESILTSVINNMKLQQMRRLESNSSRAMNMVNAYLSHENWQNYVDEQKQMSKITKQEIIDFANRVFKSNNYIIAYKHQGEKPQTQKIEKPEITPVVMNRDVESDFFKSIKTMNVKSIEPKFIDFSQDMQRGKVGGSEILYVKNKQNERFQLTYRYEYGSLYNKMLSQYTDATTYLESTNRTIQEINRQMYNIACDYSINFGSEFSTVTIKGLSENMPKAMEIVEDILQNPKISDSTVATWILDVKKSRNDAKTDQNSILSHLQNYALYSKADREKSFVTNEELQNIKAEDIMQSIRTLAKRPQRILYYGDKSLNDLQKIVGEKHKISINKMKMKMRKRSDIQSLDNKVLFAHYDAKQNICRQLSSSIEFNINNVPEADLYNEYFGGSMNSIVFQEMREKRSLAYSASAYYVAAWENGYHNYNLSHIGTQNDKLIDAISAFTDLFDNMPISEQNFSLAKQSMLTSLSTRRITKMGIINSYLSCEKLGIKEPLDKTEFSKIKGFTINDVKDFNNKYIKNQKRTIIVLGNRNEVDLKGLEKYGKVTDLSLEEVFLY